MTLQLLEHLSREQIEMLTELRDREPMDSQLRWWCNGAIVALSWTAGEKNSVPPRVAAAIGWPDRAAFPEKT